MADTERIVELLVKQCISKLTDDELNELNDWKSEKPDVREALVKRLSDHTSLGEFWRKRTLVDTMRPRQEMNRRLGFSNRKRKRLLRISVCTVAAATIGGILWMSDIPPVSEVTPQKMPSTAVNILSIDSLHPGEPIAYVTCGKETLSIGQTSSQGTTVAELQNNKTKGPIILDVPRGGEFIIVLEDSTKVWLNSATTLIYPENFTSGDRRVSVLGEAYFSVSKDMNGKPFYVETSGQEICVYGTEFNVRSYPEEESVFTTLKTGSVGLKRIDGSGGELKLSPGKQAIFDKKTHEATVRSVDIETVTGWRQGRFVFQEQTLRQIMFDLGRWYDFEFEFADKGIEDIVFMGSIPRYSDFSTAMLILEKTGGITFNVQDNKIIVRRKNNK